MALLVPLHDPHTVEEDQMILNGRSRILLLDIQEDAKDRQCTTPRTAAFPQTCPELTPVIAECRVVAVTRLDLASSFGILSKKQAKTQNVDVLFVAVLTRSLLIVKLQKSPTGSLSCRRGISRISNVLFGRSRCAVVASRLLEILRRRVSWFSKWVG